MYGSGVVTGMALIAVVHKRTLLDQPLALTVCIVAVALAAVLRTVAVLFASALPRPTGMAALASVWPYSEFFPKKKARNR